MEVIEMFNAGSIPMDYKIYIASSYDKDPISTSLSLIPCEENIFKIDHTHVTLRPDEKTSIRITYPPNDALQDIRRYSTATHNCIMPLLEQLLICFIFSVHSFLRLCTQLRLSI